MKTINILLVIKNPVGGIRTFLIYVLKYFNKAKYSITIIAPEVDGIYENLLSKLQEYSSIGNVKYIVLDRRVCNKEFIRSINKELKRDKYDLVWSHGFTSCVMSLFPALIRRCSHVTTLHDVFLPIHLCGIKGFFLRFAMFIIIILCDKIHFVSNGAKKNYLNALTVAKFFDNKLQVIYNGIELERFSSLKRRDIKSEVELSEDIFLIGFLGRFMPQKGFEYLIEAVEILSNDTDIKDRFKIVSFGWGGFIREYQIEIKKRGLEKYFYFLPFVENVSETLRGLDCIVMPSLWEACSLLPMEAMIIGIPVIGTSCIGLGELLENTPNRIISPADSNALAIAMKEEILNSTKDRAIAYVEEARRRFDVKPKAEEIEKMLVSL